jgi:hypothetical protein
MLRCWLVKAARIIRLAAISDTARIGHALDLDQSGQRLPAAPGLTKG